MHWITATDLVHWAGTRNAESDLPLLIRRLILASVENVGHLAIPSGDSIFRPGWDGLLNAAKSSWPVPEGISVWELGKTKDVLTKANEDFNKRTTKPRGVLPEDATFVFVTPRRWPDKKQDKAAWCSARIAESNWRDVRVLDADDLEVWLDQSPSVASWFARRIGKQPEGIEGLDTFWERSISDTSTRLTPGIILAGRDVFCSAIEAWAESDEPLLRIKGDTPEEAVLLLAAWALRERGPAEACLRGLLLFTPRRPGGRSRPQTAHSFYFRFLMVGHLAWAKSQKAVTG